MVLLKLSQAQLRNLSKGKSITIKHAQINDGDDYDVDDFVLSKISKSYHSGKGFRLNSVEGAGILSSLKKFGRKTLKLSDGDMNSIGHFMQPILRAGRNSSQKALLDIADKAPEVAGMKAMEALSGAGIQSQIRKLTGLSRNDMKSVNNFMKPVLRTARKSSQEQLLKIADEAPKVAGVKAMEALSGAGIESQIRKYTGLSKSELQTAHTFMKPTLRKGKKALREQMMRVATEAPKKLGDMAMKKLSGGSINPFLPEKYQGAGFRQGKGFKQGGNLENQHYHNYTDNKNLTRIDQQSFYYPAEFIKKPLY